MAVTSTVDLAPLVNRKGFALSVAIPQFRESRIQFILNESAWMFDVDDNDDWTNLTCFVQYDFGYLLEFRPKNPNNAVITPTNLDQFTVRITSGTGYNTPTPKRLITSYVYEPES